MRRIAIWLVLMLLLSTAASAQAQSMVAFEQLTIELWPDFDQPSVLVLYDFVISSETPLPAQVSIRMPAGAQLFAVARSESGDLVNVEHAPPIQEGNYSVVSFFVSERQPYRVEFYIPYVQQGQKRAFVYTWPGDYPIASFSMILQEPLAAKNVSTDPMMNLLQPRGDGLTYRSLALQNLKIGQGVTLKVSYDNPNGSLSADRPQPGGSLESSPPFMSALPWILGGIGLILIVGGGAWYWLSGRSGNSETNRMRKSHRASVAQEPADSAYCSQCGKRAQPGDRFCRVCGTRLRS